MKQEEFSSSDVGIWHNPSPKLQAAADTIKILRKFKDQENITWISFDIENSFYTPKNCSTKKAILEVGSTWVHGRSLTDNNLVNSTHHYVVEEFKYHHNRASFVGQDEYNHKNHFLYVRNDQDPRRPLSGGNSRRSICMPLNQIGPEHQRLIDQVKENGPVVIVVHRGRSDLADLKRLGCDISDSIVLDTQSMDQALRSESEGTLQATQKTGSSSC